MKNVHFILVSTGLYHSHNPSYMGVSKSSRNGRLEQELKMVQLSATRCSYIAILWVSLVSFAAITTCIASQQVFIVVSLYFVNDSIRKLLDTPSYIYFCFQVSSHFDRPKAVLQLSAVRPNLDPLVISPLPKTSVVRGWPSPPKTPREVQQWQHFEVLKLWVAAS
jgi:hypothetical protein